RLLQLLVLLLGEHFFDLRGCVLLERLKLFLLIGRKLQNHREESRKKLNESVRVGGFWGESSRTAGWWKSLSWSAAGHWKTETALSRVIWDDVIPNGFTFGRHLEDGPAKAGGDQRIPIWQALGSRHQRREKVRTFGRRVLPDRLIRSEFPA